jgi:dihydrofolate reductase
VPEALRALTREDGEDLHLIGSAQLARTLLMHDLIDEMRLMIDPIVLGQGKRLFPHDGSPTRLHLSDSQVTTTGAILATYTRPT